MHTAPLSVASEPATAHPRGKILGMGVVAGAVAANIYYNQPMLPQIAAGLDLSQAAIGLVPACTLAGFATGLFTLLPLGDRFDRKRLVLIQTALAGLFACAAAAAPGLPVLLAASFGLGMVCTVPQQLVPFASIMSPPAERGRSVGTVVSAIMIGILLGRTLGGAVSSVFGWRSVFGMAAGFMVVVFAAACWLLPRGQPTTDLPYRRLLLSLWPLARDYPVLRRVMLTQALLWAGFNAFWANLATLLAQSPLHLGSFWAGAFGIVGAAGAFAASASGRAADRIGPVRVVGYSIGLVIVAFALLFAAPYSLVLLVIGVIVLDLGVQSGLVSNQTRAFATDLQAQGRVNTLYMTAMFLGGAIGAALSGWLMSACGWAGVAGLGGGAAVVAAWVHWSGGRQTG